MSDRRGVRGYRSLGANLADAHLTYIEAECVGATRYDVYFRDRPGAQLGWVERWDGPWYGMDFKSGVEKAGRTRWEVATALWGEN